MPSYCILSFALNICNSPKKAKLLHVLLHATKKKTPDEHLLLQPKPHAHYPAPTEQLEGGRHALMQMAVPPRLCETTGRK